MVVSVVLYSDSSLQCLEEMPKQKLVEYRYDFRGGKNTYVSPELLSENELVRCENARLSATGTITKRTGTRRMHATAIGGGAAIKGIFQWDGPSGSQLVAISNGDLFYRNQSSGEYAAFTQVDPGATDAFSTTEPALFATLRANADSAPLKLYIASGGKLYEWDGTTLNRLDGTSSAVGQFAPDASLIASYHLRIFTNSLVKPQHLVWSKLADGRVYKAGLPSDGGTAMVSAINNEEIVALQTLGRSLLVFTHDSIARLAGYSAADIQIDQDTEGVSPDVGCVGPLALHRAERVVFFISDLGPYLATEGGIAPVGMKIKPDFDGLDRTKLEQIVVGHNHGRHEITVACTGPTLGTNHYVYVYNLQHQAWYGPFTYSAFGITCMSHYEDPNGDEFLIAGCDDGFIRHMDFGAKDDILSDNTGGSTYQMLVEFPPLSFGKLESAKALYDVVILADTPASTAGTRAIDFSFDDIVSTSVAITESTAASPSKQRHTILRIQGHRMVALLIDTTDTITTYYSFMIRAYDLIRAGF